LDAEILYKKRRGMISVVLNSPDAGRAMKNVVRVVDGECPLGDDWVKKVNLVPPPSDDVLESVRSEPAHERRTDESAVAGD